MAKRDCYDVLGVPRSASKDDIKKAYRKLALKYHPDKTKGDKASEEKFKEASEAYHILSDEKRKANYDQFGHAAFEGGGGGGQGFGGFDTSSFSDIFEDFFSDFGGGGSSRRSSNRGNDLRYDVNIELEEASSNSIFTSYLKSLPLLLDLLLDPPPPKSLKKSSNISEKEDVSKPPKP